MSKELVEMIRTVLREELKGVDARFDQMDKRFEGVDARFDQMDKRFEKVDKRFDQMDLRMDKMDQRLDKLEIGQENMLREMRSNTKHIEETIKEHRLVIDLLQKDAEPHITIKSRED